MADEFSEYELFKNDEQYSNIGSCLICMDLLSDSVQDCLVCHVSFHGNCLQKWLSGSAKCPHCNAEPMKFTENRSTEQLYKRISETHVTTCEYCNTRLSQLTLPGGRELTLVGEILEHHYQNCYARSMVAYKKAAGDALVIEAFCSERASVRAIKLKITDEDHSKCFIINVPDKKRIDQSIQIQLTIRPHTKIKQLFAVLCKLLSPVDSARLPVKFGIVIQYQQNLFSRLLFLNRDKEVLLTKTRYTLPALLKTFGVVF